MPRPPLNVVRFPVHAAHGDIALSDADYNLLNDTVGPFYGGDVGQLLADAAPAPGGRRLDSRHPHIDDLLAAIACEVHGFKKLDEERDGRARNTPKSGSTAARLLAIYRHIEERLS